ncbi:beta-L-arabinofuranosidase domain-containing protein [Streptomyces spiralis]
MASFEAAVANEDTLDGEHTNQHIPQHQGYLEIYEQTGEQPYFTAARNFWDMVVPHRTYVDGGMAGSGEIFGARDVIARSIQKSNAETCLARSRTGAVWCGRSPGSPTREPRRES